MDGQLVQVCGPSNSVSALIALVKDLRQEVAGLRADVRALQRENLELRQQAGYWKSRHRDALGRITALEQNVEHLEGEKRQLQADLFGRRSETRPRNDRSNDWEDPQDDSQGPQRRRGQQPENPGPATGLLPSARPRGGPRTASRALCLSPLRPTRAPPQRHRRLGADRD